MLVSIRTNNDWKNSLFETLRLSEEMGSEARCLGVLGRLEHDNKIIRIIVDLGVVILGIGLLYVNMYPGV